MNSKFFAHFYKKLNYHLLKNIFLNKIFQNYNLLFLFIFMAFSSEVFASKTNKTNNKKIVLKKNNKANKINNKLTKIHEEEDDDDDKFFDYESLYKNSLSETNIEQELPKKETEQSEFLSDFGIIKNTVEEKKTIKKYESEDDEIFLSKEIFDEKNKIKLRKSATLEKSEPFEKYKISNRVVSDLSLTRNYGNRLHNFYDTAGVVRYFSSIQLNRNFEFYGLFRFARIDNDNDLNRRNSNPHGGGSRTFENMGITLSELSLKYTQKNTSLIAGKFTANFGTAWRWNKGIMIHSLASDYALSDKLGLALITKYGDTKKTGLYNFSLSFFTNDRKNFDNALFHRRESDKKSDAIAGDTRSLSSYSFATDVNFVFSEREKLNYHIGFSKLAINKEWAFNNNITDLKKQQGLVFGMNYEFPINQDFGGETILEHAKIKNINGVLNTMNSYLTTNFILKYQNKYSLLLGNSTNKNHLTSELRSKSTISEVNLGYEFSKNKYFDKLTTQIGYYQNIRKIDLANQKNKSIAILVRYFKNF